MHSFQVLDSKTSKTREAVLKRKEKVGSARGYHMGITWRFFDSLLICWKKKKVSILTRAGIKRTTYNNFQWS